MSWKIVNYAFRCPLETWQSTRANSTASRSHIVTKSQSGAWVTLEEEEIFRLIGLHGMRVFDLFGAMDMSRSKIFGGHLKSQCSSPVPYNLQLCVLFRQLKQNGMRGNLGRAFWKAWSESECWLLIEHSWFRQYSWYVPCVPYVWYVCICM
jgi:hypothetical protein